MNNEKFCLRWNDFESNISSAFRELRDDKDFFDITLVCDDEQIQAHKVILSACSPFFLKIFRRNPHQHPLLYLKGVKFMDLQAVLNFMYHGEVNVAQEELNSFLAVAEDLKVKGLTQNKSEPQVKKKQAFKSPQDASIIKSHQRPPDREPQPPKHAWTPSATNPDHRPQYEDIQEVIPIKSEPRETLDQSCSRTSQQLTTQVYTNPQPVALAEQEDSLNIYQEEEEVDEYDQYGQYEEQYGQHQENIGQSHAGEAEKGPQTPDDLGKYVITDQNVKQYHCALCDSFKAKLPSKVKNHVEAIHFPGLFVYTCEVCHVTCKGKNALNVHKSKRHNIKAKSSI